MADTERLALEVDEYMDSEVVDTGVTTIEILINVYAAGDVVSILYRHGNSEANCLAADWDFYVAPFESLGYVQIRLISSL